MKVLIMYYSRSGNTKKLAEAVAGGVRRVEGAECVLKTCAEVTPADFESARAVIAGSPVYFGTMAAELKAALDKLVIGRRQMEGKVGAAFATGGGESGGKETTLLSILQAFLIYGMVVVGDPLAAGGHYGAACLGTPGADAAAQAAALGRRVAELAQRLSTGTASSAI